MIVDERGVFWWASDVVPPGQFAPDAAVTGRLTIEEKGTTLLQLDQLLGKYDHPFQSLLQTGEDVATCIIGKLTPSGRHVCMFRPRKARANFSTNNVSFEHWASDACIAGDVPPVGGKFPTEFASLEIGLEGHEDWLGLSNLHLSHSESGFSIRYSRPLDNDWVENNVKASIKFDCVYPRYAKQSHQVDCAETATIYLDFDRMLSFDEVMLEYEVLSDFLKLLTGSTANLSWPILRSEDERRSALYFTRLGEVSADLSNRDFWASYVEVRATFWQAYFEFRSKREQIGPAFYLYLGTRRGLTIYSEHLFANFMWGLESLHRERFGDGKPPTRLIEKVARILAGIINESDQKWLAKVLEYSLKPSLADRLVELFTSLSLDLDEKALRQFATNCADTRNTLSHVGGARDKGPYKAFITELACKNEMLSALYHALLIKECGFPLEIASRYFFRGFRSHLVQRSMLHYGLVSGERIEAERRSTKPQLIAPVLEMAILEQPTPNDLLNE